MVYTHVLSIPFYITHAASKKWFSIVKYCEPSVSSLLWHLHYESLPGQHGVVPPPVENNFFAFQPSAFRSGKKSC